MHYSLFYALFSQFILFLLWKFKGFSSHYSLGILIIFLFYIKLSPFLIQIEQRKCIFKHSLFNFIVKRRVCSKWRWLINFNQPRSEIFIDHYIKSQNLKSHGVINAFRLAHSVHIMHIRLSGYNSFDNYIFDFIKYFIWVSTFFINNFQNRK